MRQKQNNKPEEQAEEDKKDSFYYKKKRWNILPIYDVLKQKYYVEVDGQRSDELHYKKIIARSEI